MDEDDLQVDRGPARLAVRHQGDLAEVAGRGGQRPARLDRQPGQNDVVLQVAADAGQVVPDLQADLLKLGGGTDPGAQQEVRAADGSRAQDDLGRGGVVAPLVVDDDIDAGAAVALHRQPFDERPLLELEVPAIEGRPEVGGRGALPPAVHDQQVVAADAPQPRPVQVGRERMSGLLGRGQVRLRQRVQARGRGRP